MQVLKVIYKPKVYPIKGIFTEDFI